MQINLLSISLWIIKRLSTFVCAYLPKQNQNGRECGHLLAGWRNELTLLADDKEAFMEAAHCMEWVYSLLTDQRCGTPTTCYQCLSQTGTTYPHERPAKQTTKFTATTHWCSLEPNRRQDSTSCRFTPRQSIENPFLKKYFNFCILTAFSCSKTDVPQNVSSSFYLILGQTVSRRWFVFLKTPWSLQIK